MTDQNSPSVASGTNDSYTLPRRHFKFRAWADGKMWSFENKKWLLFADSGFVAFADTPIGSQDETSDNCSDPELHLMQYTGLIDKNGAEICEGDIVEITDPLTDCAALKTVYFEDGCFVVKIDDDYTPCLCEFLNRKIVGNIFEHPELLKGV